MVAIRDFVDIVYGGIVICPHCKKCEPRVVMNKRGWYRCAQPPYAQFSILKDTFFHGREIVKWMEAIQLFSTNKQDKITGSRKTKEMYFATFSRITKQRTPKANGLRGCQGKLISNPTTSICALMLNSGRIYLSCKENIFSSSSANPDAEYYIPRWAGVTKLNSNDPLAHYIQSVIEAFHDCARIEKHPNLKAYRSEPVLTRREKQRKAFREDLQIRLNQFAYFYNRGFDSDLIFRDLLCAISKLKKI